MVKIVPIVPDMVKRILLPLILFLFILISLPASGFTKSESFVNYTANMIYQECNGKNIIIKPNMIDTNIQKNHTLLEWPYSKEIIKEIIKIFSSEDFNEHKVAPPLIDSRRDGLELIKCETNKLDVIGRNWYWNDIEIIPPLKTDITNVNQTVNQTVNEKTFIKIGDVSFSILGGVSVISISIVSLTFISIGGFILYLSRTKKIDFKKFEIIYKKK